MTPDVKIPEGIPTWVNAAPVTVATPVQASPTPAVATEGLLDRAVRSMAKFFAKLLGKPDPITGQPNTPATVVASDTTKKVANFADKVWSAANKVVDTAAEVATKTVETAKTTVNETVAWVKEVSADISASTADTTAPATTQPLETLEKTQ